MSDKEQRIAIAKACGWKVRKNAHLAKPQGGEWQYMDEIPDYLNDLNAMHEAIGTLLFSQRRAYRINLKEIMSKKINPAVICYSECIDAPAAQRAEALLKTIGKWTTNQNEQ
jgi:hypothetical protein